MSAFLKQAVQLLIGRMAGSNQKAAFVVKAGRAAYIMSAGTIGITWYSAWRNERVKPGTAKFPFPLVGKLKRQFAPDRPEKELEHAVTQNTAFLQSGQKASALGVIGPPNLQKGINKANQLSGHYPYVWGGGHARLGEPSGGGYDCSGAVSAVLGAMGLLTTPLTSGLLANWGLAGEGTFVTVYANEVHTFMKINVNGTWHWFGTGSDKQAMRGGPAWGNHDPDLRAYSVRHPAGE